MTFDQHQRSVERAGRDTLHYLKHSEHATGNHHESASAVYKELAELRKYDSGHGFKFKDDLKEINRKVHDDPANRHLPSVAEDGHGFTFRANGTGEGGPPHKHAPEQESYAPHHSGNHGHAHEGHHSHQGGHRQDSRFATPSEGHADDSSRHVKDTVPGDKSPSKSGFGEKLLKRLGLPDTPENLKFLDAWQRAEGGSADNPFNTTQDAPGAVNFNRIGVKRYPSIDEGVEATAKTLSNGKYNNILNSLKQSNTHQAAVELASGPWGTHNITNFA
jgi:hypothetical protein